MEPVKRQKHGGRKKGSVNKLTKSVKEAFETVFAELQADPRQDYALANWGKANPTTFYQLAAKLIPTQMNANVQGSINIVNEFND